MDAETKRRAREFGVAGLAGVIGSVSDDPSYAAPTFDGEMRMVIDHAHAETGGKRVESPLKSAKLRYPQAGMSNIVYESRPLSRDLGNHLGTTQFVAGATDVIPEGFTGTGKSHLARALGKQACKRGIGTMHVRMPDMLACREGRMGAGWADEKVLRKFASCRILISL